MYEEDVELETQNIFLRHMAFYFAFLNDTLTVYFLLLRVRLDFFLFLGYSQGRCCQFILYQIYLVFSCIL